MVPMPWSAQAQANKTQKDPRKADGNKVLLINLEEYGPVKINQAAFAVLKPAITIERHDDQLEISLRFHLQTSILGFEEVDGEHVQTFQYISLQYLYGPEDALTAKPISDPLAAFQVTDAHSGSENVGETIPARYQTPGPVQYTVLKKARLEVEKKVNTWSLALLARTSAWGTEERLACQWYWRAISKSVTTDVAAGVTRGVIVTRHVPTEDVYASKAGFTVQSMRPYLNFDFQIQVLLRKPDHSLEPSNPTATHPSNLASSHGEALPAKVTKFHCRANVTQALVDQIPTEDTADMETITDNLQNRHHYNLRNPITQSLKGSMLISGRGSSMYDVLTIVDGR